MNTGITFLKLIGSVILATCLAAVFVYAFFPADFMPPAKTQDRLPVTSDVRCTPRPFERLTICTRASNPAACVVTYPDGIIEDCRAFIIRNLNNQGRRP